MQMLKWAKPKKNQWLNLPNYTINCPQLPHTYHLRLPSPSHTTHFTLTHPTHFQSPLNHIFYYLLKIQPHMKKKKTKKSVAENQAIETYKYAVDPLDPVVLATEIGWSTKICDYLDLCIIYYKSVRISINCLPFILNNQLNIHHVNTQKKTHIQYGASMKRGIFYLLKK